MALSAKPERKRTSIAKSGQDVRTVINRGGTVAKAEDLEVDTLRRVQLRLYGTKIAEIDAAIEQSKATRKRKPTFSRHKWLEEAIEEKLERDS
jgi:hypothetical protein